MWTGARLPTCTSHPFRWFRFGNQRTPYETPMTSLSYATNARGTVSMDATSAHWPEMTISVRTVGRVSRARDGDRILRVRTSAWNRKKLRVSVANRKAIPLGFRRRGNVRVSVGGKTSRLAFLLIGPLPSSRWNNHNIFLFEDIFRSTGEFHSL